MSPVWKILQKYQLRKALKKQLAAVKNFLHTDDDILEEAARKELAGVIAAGEALLQAPQGRSLQEAHELPLRPYQP